MLLTFCKISFSCSMSKNSLRKSTFSKLHTMESFDGPDFDAKSRLDVFLSRSNRFELVLMSLFMFFIDFQSEPGTLVQIWAFHAKKMTVFMKKHVESGLNHKQTSLATILESFRWFRYNAEISRRYQLESRIQDMRPNFRIDRSPRHFFRFHFWARIQSRTSFFFRLVALTSIFELFHYFRNFQYLVIFQDFIDFRKKYFFAKIVKKFKNRS